jgi:hypothetical protein
MGRAILGAVIGYVVITMLVVLGITIVWNTMGNEFAFEGETNRASTPWTICMLLSGAVAAVVAGATAAVVAGPRRELSVQILLGLVIVLGTLSLVGQLASTPPALPAGKAIRDLTFFEAGTYAVTPMWYTIAVIFVGALGVYLGGRMVRPSAKRRAQKTPA